MADQTILEFVRDAVSVPDDSYDTVLLTNINAIIFGLYQLGAVELVEVTPETVWTGITFLKPSIISLVKQVIALRARYMFDSSTSQQGILYESISEYESRILIEMDLNPIVSPVVTP